MSGLRLGLAVILGILSSANAIAQQIEVLDFEKYKPSQPGIAIDIDKTGSIIDFRTGESGFTFLADGKTPVEAQEEDGTVRITAPHRTSYLVIKHPDFGQCTWKAPVKLKRFKHYSAYLATYSPDKLFKLSKQWLTFNVWPPEAIVTVDSTTTLVRDGRAQFYLPVGTHKYLVEAPFHSSVCDSIPLTDSAKEELDIHLQPFYSYLTVRPGDPDSEVYLDREFLGRGDLTTGRITPGPHRLTVLWNGIYYYDAEIIVGEAEKKTVSLDRDSNASLFWQSNRWGIPKEALASTGKQPLTVEIRADVEISAPGTGTEIFINRESVGFGKWSGTLPEGFYAISTRRDGVESRVQFLRIEESSPIKLSLAPPEADYATLSVHSNVIGAEVYVNGELSGVTPCIVQGLPGRQNYRIMLKKEGYKETSVFIKPYGNDLTDVNIKMKARKGR